jgi:pyruvate kinase
MPAEAAGNRELLEYLLEQGMDCARINCAHDGMETWTAMLGNLRSAANATGRPCRVLMDLPGHKIRTGPLQSRTAAWHIKPRRDRFGKVEAPATVLLGAEDDPQPGRQSPASDTAFLPVDTALVQALAPGDRIRFRDLRGKKRELEIVERTASGHVMAHCNRSCYLSAETGLEWHSCDRDGEFRCRGLYHPGRNVSDEIEIRLFEGDRLLLRRTPEPARPPRYDEAGGEIEPASIACIPAQILDGVKPGDPVWLDDARLGGRVEEVGPGGAIVRVTRARASGYRLKADRGINFPDSPNPLPVLSEHDRELLPFVCRHADMIGLSFVESVVDLNAFIDAIDAAGGRGIPLVIKVETRAAVRNLADMLFAVLGRRPVSVMIARGDLAVELGPERMAEIQEELLWLCEAAHVSVIWATQVLETLAKKGQMSRPELTDAAMGERAECVMLNKGPHVVRAVQLLDDVLARMEGHQLKKRARLRALRWGGRSEPPQA